MPAIPCWYCACVSAAADVRRLGDDRARLVALRARDRRRRRGPRGHLAARNLPNVGICDAASIDPVVLIRFEKVLVTLPALKLIEERLS